MILCRSRPELSISLVFIFNQLDGFTLSQIPDICPGRSLQAQSSACSHLALTLAIALPGCAFPLPSPGRPALLKPALLCKAILDHLQ